MSSLLIIKPLPLASLTLAGSAIAVDAFKSPDPKEVFAFAGGGGYAGLDLDLGSIQSLDSFFVGFTNPATSDFGIWGITGGAAAYTDTAINYLGVQMAAASDVSNPRRRHLLYRLAAPVSARYIRITLGYPGPDAFTHGIIAVGLALQPLWGREWGSGRQVQDMSAVAELRGGGFGIERGARKPIFQFTLGDLSNAEVAELWNVMEDIGESSPVIICEDPDDTAGLNERLHYGLIDKPDAYMRELPNLNRWSFRLKGWV